MLKVLIADDEPRVGQLVKHLIHWEELGLSFVDICRDGRTALERIEQEQPEVVITAGVGAVSADTVCGD